MKREFVGITGKLSCELSETATVAVLTLSGRADVDTSPELGRILEALIGRGQPRILLDAGGLEYCDSSTLRSLLSAQKKARAAGGAIKLLDLGREPRRVFEVSGFLTLFETFENRETALQSFAVNPKKE